MTTAPIRAKTSIGNGHQHVAFGPDHRSRGTLRIGVIVQLDMKRLRMIGRRSAKRNDSAKILAVAQSRRHDNDESNFVHFRRNKTRIVAAQHFAGVWVVRERIRKHPPLNIAGYGNQHMLLVSKACCSAKLRFERACGGAGCSSAPRSRRIASPARCRHRR